MPKPNEFDIPRPFYFESGNYFTGSKGNFNFKIVPKDETLYVTFWHGFLCSDLAEMEGEQEFPLSEEGFQLMLEWLKEKDSESLS
ncbi:MAG: hypothetical protein V3G42_06675 [Oscillospiraceae bacterium]